MLYSEENIIVLMTQATPEDLHRASGVFSHVSQYDTYIFGGEIKIDILMLSEEQKIEIRNEFGLNAIFSDGSGEAGDVNVYLSCDIELTDDAMLVVTGYTFISHDASADAELGVDNYSYAVPHPTAEQIRDTFLPFLLRIA